MKKALSSLLAVATIAGSLVTVMPTAKAEGGRNAAAVGIGLLGLGLGVAAATAQPRYYGDPGPAYYAPAPRCHWEQRTVWDQYRYTHVYQNVQVCY
jgi:hypothetical protein